MVDLLKNTITLAGLLHDIGKLYQRTGEKKLNSENEIYCPTIKRHLSHIHVGFTAQFFDNFNQNFSKHAIIQNEENSLQNLSAMHHKPSNPYQWIIAYADRLVSGMERDEYENYSSLSSEEETQQYNYKKARLLSIFSRVKISKYNNVKEKFYNLEKLNPKILPQDLKEKSSEEAEAEYLKLKNEFENDLGKLEADFNFNNFFNSLSTLLEKYLWCVPSSSYGITANVSLFDHMKTTSAIATALYVYLKENNLIDNLDEYFKIEDVKFILVQGDFSGIQSFIFSRFGESNKYAAKILRAKSFYVSIFTEIAAYLLIEEFDTNASSIIINAGGKFTLLLPEINDYEKKIKKVFKKINNYIFNMTYGQTRFNLAYVKLTGEDFFKKRISDKFSELAYNLQVNKLKPVIETPVFENYLDEVAKSGGVCKIDGYSPKANEDFSEISKEFIKIGEKLPKNDFINIYKGNEGEFTLLDNISFSIDSNYKVDSFLSFKINPDKNFSGIAEKMLSYYIPTFSKEDLASVKYTELTEKDFDNSDFKEGKVKSFAHIAVDAKQRYEENGEEKYIGKAFLGVLKADIDNLGEIFSKGFGEKCSFADIVSLSRMFDYFFTGWLPYKIKNNYPSIYTVFAGGDDLFLIGPYNQIINISNEISNHLKEYVAGNSDIHISAGISIKRHQVPVYQMADDAEDLLDKSKESDGKNSITVFGVTVKWDEFNKLLEYEKILDSFLNKEIKTSFLYKILKFIKMAEDLKNEKVKIYNIRNAMWMPLLRYLVIRNYKDKEFQKELLSFFVSNIQNFGEKLIIPISLTIYKRRK